MTSLISLVYVLSVSINSLVNGFTTPSKTFSTKTWNAVTISENVDEIPSSASSINPDMKAYAAGYGTVFDELPFKICEPKGGKDTLPSDLIGTYFKSGPAMFSAGSLLPPKKSIVQPKQPPVPDGEDKDRMVKHPFEGDGGILGKKGMCNFSLLWGII